MKISIMVKKAWGREFLYPGCDFSKMLCHLLKQKTLTDEQIKTIKEYGYKPIFLDYEKSVDEIKDFT